MPSQSFEQMEAMTAINTVIRDHLRREADADMEDIDLLKRLGEVIRTQNALLQQRGEGIDLADVAASLVDFQNAKYGDSITDEIIDQNLKRQTTLVEKLRRSVSRG